MNRTAPRLLIVEDDERLAKLIRALFAGWGWDAVQAYGVDEAIAKAADIPLDLILLDLMMPGKNGIEFLRHYRDRAGAVPVAVTSAVHSGAIFDAAMALNPDYWVPKPVRLPELKAIADGLAQRFRAWRAGTQAPATATMTTEG